MESSDFKVAISFKCRKCDGAAKLIHSDAGLERVFCPACGIRVDGDDAVIMHNTFVKDYRNQLARNLSRSEINQRGMGRVPLRKVMDELTNPRRPFIAKFVADD